MRVFRPWGLIFWQKDNETAFGWLVTPKGHVVINAWYGGKVVVFRYVVNGRQFFERKRRDVGYTDNGMLRAAGRFAAALNRSRPKRHRV